MRYVLLLTSLVFALNHTMASEAWSTMEPSEFWNLDVVNEKISVDKFDPDLLEAAVFHETNRVRDIHKKPSLLFSPAAGKAARAHSQWMAKRRRVSHTGIDPIGRKTTALTRIREKGVDPLLVAENVAFTFILEYQSGTPVFLRNKGDSVDFSLEANGPPLPHRTYKEMAKAIVAQFMASPQHRKGILLDPVTHSGMGVAILHNKKDMDRVYVTQMFYEPMQ